MSVRSEHEVLMDDLGEGGRLDEEVNLPTPRAFSLQLESYNLLAAAIVVLSLVLCSFLLGRGTAPSDSCVGCENTEERCDFAVIGGGIGGVYTAQRLASSMKTKSVCLFESTSRIGGRLWSQTVAGAETLPLEVGGMRFLPDVHRLVRDLATHLNMNWQPQPIFVPGNYFVLRNTLVTWESWTNGSVPYHFLPSELQLLISSGQGPFAFFSYVLEQVLPPAGVYRLWDACEWQNWTRTATFRGKLLRDLGVEYLLRQFLSPEALASFEDFMGFNDITKMVNAAEMIAWERKEDAASGGAPFQRFNDGYQQLPLRLLKQAVAAGVKVFLNCTVMENLGRVSKSGDIVLRFAERQVVHVREHVVYALPRGALEYIPNLGGELSSAKGMQAVSSVMPFYLFKLFLLFDSSWWTSVLPSMNCIATGACGTLTHSEPDKKVFFWGVADSSGPSSDVSAVLVTYTDGSSARYWASLLRGQEEAPFYLQPNPYTDALEPASSMRRLAEAIRELRVLVRASNGSATVPEPYAAVFADWTQPHRAGVHIFNIGADAVAVREYLRTQSDVSVCGEAYSDMQGWVEGALRSCELLLTTKWRLAPPVWYNASVMPLSDYLSCA